MIYIIDHQDSFTWNVVHQFSKFDKVYCSNYFDINKKKLELYPTTGKFDFIISSFSKECGHYKFKESYKCSIYKPLISSNLIN